VCIFIFIVTRARHARDTREMAKKNNKKTAAARIADAQRIEREHNAKKAMKAAKKAVSLNIEDMMVDASDVREAVVRAKAVRTVHSAEGSLRVKAKGVMKKKSGRDGGGGSGAIGGKLKERRGKNTHKLVRGVLLKGKVKLRKNAVVRGIKVVDAATKQMALDALAGESGMATAMR